MSGQGLLQTGDETVEGTFYKNKLSGQGKRVFSSGDSYEGKWVDGVLEGFGKYETQSVSYQGNFANNVENGYGILTTSSFVYQGNFQNGLFHGQGR